MQERRLEDRMGMIETFVGRVDHGHRCRVSADTRSPGGPMPTDDDQRPSVKDEEQYDALRREGASKEKAARIANTDRSTAGERGGSSPAYEEWTKDDLYERAQEIGIDGRSDMTKDELVDALRNH